MALAAVQPPAGRRPPPRPRQPHLPARQGGETSRGVAAAAGSLPRRPARLSLRRLAPPAAPPARGGAAPVDADALCRGELRVSPARARSQRHRQGVERNARQEMTAGHRPLQRRAGSASVASPRQVHRPREPGGGPQAHVAERHRPSLPNRFRRCPCGARRPVRRPQPPLRRCGSAGRDRRGRKARARGGERQPPCLSAPCHPPTGGYAARYAGHAAAMSFDDALDAKLAAEIATQDAVILAAAPIRVGAVLAEQRDRAIAMFINGVLKYVAPICSSTIALFPLRPDRPRSPARPRYRHRGSRATRVSTNGARAYRRPGVRLLRVPPRPLPPPDRPAR